MKSVLCLGILFSVLSQPSAALAEGEPFAELIDQVNGQWGGWAGEKQKLCALFAEERSHLGKEFQAELLRFLGTDPVRHYWVGLFLSSEEFLEGQDADPELALLVYQQGIVLCQQRAEEQDMRALQVSLRYCAALLSQQMGLKTQAIAHRRVYEDLCAKESILIGATPIVPQASRELFNSIPHPAG